MNVTTILIIVSVFSAISITVLVLMQQSKGDMGSAFGGGGSQSMFGSRGSANFLSRATSIMVTVLFASCLALAYLYAKRNAEANVIDTIQVEDGNEVPSLDGIVDESADANNEAPEIPDDASALDEATDELIAPPTSDGTDVPLDDATEVPPQ